MRRVRRKRTKKPWHFDDYDESDYSLDSENERYHTQSRAICRKTDLNSVPKNSSLQIRITGNISISLVGDNGHRQEIVRLVDLWFQVEDVIIIFCGFNHHLSICIQICNCKQCGTRLEAMVPKPCIMVLQLFDSKIAKIDLVPLNLHINEIIFEK